MDLNTLYWGRNTLKDTGAVNGEIEKNGRALIVEGCGRALLMEVAGRVINITKIAYDICLYIKS